VRLVCNETWWGLLLYYSLSNDHS